MVRPSERECGMILYDNRYARRESVLERQYSCRDTTKSRGEYGTR